MAVAYEPIKAAGTLDGQGTVNMSRAPQAASQTYKPGVPLILVSGYLQEATFGAAQIVYGVAQEGGANLAVAGTSTTTSEGVPINQPSAKIFAPGAWMKDGKQGFYNADGRNVFSIMLKDGQVFTQAMVASGTLYGLVKDGTTGLWYLDNTDTSGDNAVARVLGVDSSSPNTAAGGARVYFQFDSAKRFFN